MARASSATSEFSIELPPTDWALVQFLARQRGESPSKILGMMIEAYVRSDSRFVPNEFLAFVRTELGPATPNRGARDQLLREVVGFAKEQHMSEEPTATLAEAPTRRRTTGKR